MRGQLRVVIVLALVMAFAGCGKNQDVRVLKMAHSLDVTHPVHRAMIFFGESLAEKSGGRIRLEVFPSEQLGSEREIIEQIQVGCLDLTKISASTLENFVPVVGVFSVPYLFQNQDHLWRVLNGPVGANLLLAGESVGLRGICYYDAGSRSFYTKDHPINSPDDLKGMKIRVMQSRTAMSMVTALGASPTPISWGELYTALQQGIVDGAENNPPSLTTSRHFEVCRYYSLDEHTMVPDVVIISTVVWRSLDPETQRIVQEAANESMAYERRLWDEFTKASMDSLRAAGVVISTPDKAPFMDRVADMQRSYDGSPIGEYITEIRAAAEVTP